MIDVAGIPVIAGNMASLREHAMMIAVAGTGYIDTGERVHTTWQDLRPHYLAPEAGQLMAATGPVATVCRHVGTNLQQARDALTAYADTVETIQGELDALRTRAADVNSAITAAGDDWRSDHDLVDRSNAVIDAVSVQAVAFTEAQRACANALRALHGQPPLTVDNGDGVIDPATEFGYTLDQYQAAARADTDQGGGLPWGSVAEPDHPWYIDVATAPLRFVGGLGDAIVNTAIGAATLFGYDHATGQTTGATAGAAWTNLGKLVLAVGTYALPAAHVHDRLGTMPFLEPGEAGQILTDTGKALIAYDQWDDDPARAAGNAVGNIVLAVVGTKGAGAGLRGAGAALQLTRHGSLTARTGAAVTRAGEAIGRLPTLTDLAGNTWRHLHPPAAATPDAAPTRSESAGAMESRSRTPGPVLESMPNELQRGEAVMPSVAHDLALHTDGPDSVGRAATDPLLVQASGPPRNWQHLAQPSTQSSRPAIHHGSVPPAVADAFVDNKFPQLRDTNRGGRGTDAIAYHQNCTHCVVAVNNQLDGTWSQATPRPRLGDSMSDLKNSMPPMQGFRHGSWDSVIDQMANLGEGTRAIVYIARPNLTAHVFNAVHTSDGVIFLDGQTGGLARLEANVPIRLYVYK
jgi:hypothetical protein